MNVLEKIIASTEKRVENEKKQGLPPERSFKSKPFIFEKALRRYDMAFICEVKRASPSKGVIADNFPFTDIARQYVAAGASAVSVLTEPEFFRGSNYHLSEIRKAVEIPLLRKDFIIDMFQIEQSFRLGADAVLLIAGILTPKKLSLFIEEADRLGMSSLVEVHDESELRTAAAAGARVIGVNNRDLRTLEVDIKNSIRLRRLTPEGTVFVSESGIQTREDVELVRKNGVDAVLVGDVLMRSADKIAALKALKGEKE